MKSRKEKLQENLNNSLKDGAAFSASDSIKVSYATPFALALGASNVEIGILNSAPSLLMVIFQFLAKRTVYKMNRRTASLIFSLVHKLIWIPIIFIPIFYPQGLWLFIILFTVSGALLSVANTSWSSWIGCIVPERIRGKFFGKRSMLQNAFSFIFILIGGYLLGMINGLDGFSVIFFVSLVAGLISYFYLRKIPDARIRCENFIKKKRVDMIGLLKGFKKYRNFAPFVRHMSLLYFSVTLASPFFAVYILTVMNAGYEWYAIFVASEIVTRILMTRYWGKMADKFGDRNIMALCNVMIIFYPLLFLLVRVPFQLILISVFSGFAWSGFDLTVFNYLLDVTPPKSRTSYIANYKIAIGIAFFLGPLLGGLLSQYFSTVSFPSLDGLQTLFLLSFFLRLVFSSYGLPKLREVRYKRTMPVTDVFAKTFQNYPFRGSSHELIQMQHQFEHIERDFEKKLKKDMKGVSKL